MAATKRTAAKKTTRKKARTKKKAPAIKKTTRKVAKKTQAKRRPGRPKIVIDANLVRRIEGLAANGLTKDQIARSCGFSYQTLNEKSKQYSEISEAIKNGQAKGVATMTNALFQLGTAGNLGAQCFYLKNRDPDNWRDKQDHEVTGKGGAPIGPALIVQTGTVIKPS